MKNHWKPEKMEQIMEKNRILEQLESKFNSLGQDVDVHLEGLLNANLITYWDYIHADTLLTLQKPRTVHPDEMVFIMYHQINELLFKMILWEIRQISFHENLTTDFFATRLDRISRYFDMLASSFEIMEQGMDVQQYLDFRTTLTPASGFQSAQYRLIEFASTELINLIDVRFRETIDRDTPFTHAYEHLYWQAAGKDHQTGNKSTLLQLFEKKYMDDFIVFMQDYNEKNLWTVFQSLPEVDRADVKLRNAMRHYDHTVNVLWVMAHFNAAAKYLDPAGADEGTGGSHWKKYMHPKYQKRIFFPDLWSKEELDNWGVDNLEGHAMLSE